MNKSQRSRRGPRARHIVFLKGESALERRAELEREKIRCLGLHECALAGKFADNEALLLDTLGVAIFDMPKGELTARFGAASVVSDFKVQSPKYLEAEAVSARVMNATLEAAGETWGRKAVAAPPGAPDGEKIKVCVVDSGLVLSHPDFRDRKVTARGFPTASLINDRLGHGTRCAGIICGPAHPQAGIPRYGIAPNVELFVANVFGMSMDTSVSSVCSAVEWAITENCDIVSLSLQADLTAGDAITLAEDIKKFSALAQRALERGTLLVACTGNASNRNGGRVVEASFPARCDGVLAVGGVDKNGSVMSMCNAGAQLFGPGDDIFSSSKDGKYKSGSGTSFAAAFVAGVAALHAQDTETRGQELINALRRSGGPAVVVTPPELADNPGAILVHAPPPVAGPAGRPQ